jgi:anti-sigma regulatory factor (Ser/Thr protein kinase)
MILHLSLDLPEDGSYIKIVRLLSTTLLNYMKVTVDDVHDIEFVIGELCSNVTRHSHSTAGRFQVSVDYYPGRVEIEVKDSGGGFSFKDVQPVGTIRKDASGGVRYGGFGLHLVEIMSDHLEFARTEPQGTTVRAEKVLRYITEKDRCEALALDNMDAGGMLKFSA